MNTPINLSFDQWMREFEPRTNILNKQAPHMGCMYETFGAEAAFVKECAKNRTQYVWTLLDNDVIVEGYKFVNRLGYFITSKPFKLSQSFEIK